jgi:Mn2+/Fe2+ NRAMP family transporter
MKKLTALIAAAALFGATTIAPAIAALSGDIVVAEAKEKTKPKPKPKPKKKEEKK